MEIDLVQARRLARDIAARILRGQLSVEQGAREIFDVVRRCGPEAVPVELRVFQSWTALPGDSALSPEYAQAILEWAVETASREPGR